MACPFKRIIGQMKARAEVLDDAYRVVKDADPVLWGGVSRHKFAVYNAKANVMAANIALSTAVADLETPFNKGI